MKIGVITPVYQTPRAWLEHCLASVARQTIPCTHVVVSDGDDSVSASEFPNVEFFRLPHPHGDAGNVARAVGSVSAVARGFDAIGYLDADNWYEPDHLEQMVLLHQRTGAAVCSSARNLIDLDGRMLGRCREVDGERLVDTSCLFLTRAAFGIVSTWYLMPAAVACVGDRVVWKAIKDQKLSRAHRDVPTVNYRTHYRSHYQLYGKTPPAGAKHAYISMTPDGEFHSARVSVNEAAANRPTAPPKRPAVSLCMIVRNEEEHLGECLAPLAGLFHETIVVDTGSTDRTKEVAARYGAKVYDFRWVDSFAAARNESLKHASGEWIMWLDADDRFDAENLEKLKRLLNALPDQDNVYMMCQWSIPDRAAASPLVVNHARLFRNSPKARWSYRVHEQIFMALKENGAREVTTDIVIRHLGYQETSLRRRKQERNIRLLQMELEAAPQDAFVLFNLANAYIDLGSIERALGLLQCCVACGPARASYLARAYFLLMVSCHLLGRDDEALRHAREGRQMFPESADLLFQEGVLLHAKGALREAQVNFETILKLAPQRHYVGTDANLTGYRTRYNLALVYRGLEMPEKAAEQLLHILEHTPEHGPAWLAILELYLGQKRLADCDRLLKRLEGKPYAEEIGPALQARIAVAKGDLVGARQILEQAVARHPRVVWLRNFLADMLLRLIKDEQSAERQLRGVLEVAPNDPQAKLRLAQLLAARQSNETTRVHPHGYWMGGRNEHHYFDRPLADALAELFEGASVADLGCGDGRYVRHLRERGIRCDGWDGNPQTPALEPSCRVLDLSRNAELGATYDWVLSLEVGEHVPAQYEDVFLDNLHRHNRVGIVLSWAVPGQGGLGHVNEQPNAHVRARLAALGYAVDAAAEQRLRAAATYPWFRNTLMVFRRPKSAAISVK